ncbi:MAG: hypothetical protein QOG62_2016 [Thermoleophilaceae bacterium]|nr:hypothetical protein [Thermoleophilaceae bacterium]
MRELDRNSAANTPAVPTALRGRSLTSPDVLAGTVAIVGRGRVGRAIAQALKGAGVDVAGPFGRDETPEADVILLCVPDAAIPAAAASMAGRARMVGHTSGATPLSALAPSGAAAFGLHPLQTFPGDSGDSLRFQGCGCAVAGSDSESLDAATALARALGMNPFEIADADRPAYHAAASVASNFLVTLEAAAEAIAAGAGLDPDTARASLAPLVRASVDNWARLGPAQALTGPVARGDEPTVASQRAAVERVAPELADLFDSLLAQTRRLASEGSL